MRGNVTKIALITGAAGGIGAATAEVFSKAGFYTIGVDNMKPSISDPLDRFICADIAEIDLFESIFKEIGNREGCLDVLVNNAAIQLIKPLVETEEAEWDRVMATNVRSAFLAIKYAFPLMRRKGGSIINISSVHAVATSKNISAYATSKGALIALTRAAALELAKDGIRVNAVLPGAIDTDMLRSGLSRGHLSDSTIKNQLNELGQKHPAGRIGKPEEIARVILFLAEKNQSSFMTGQTIIVDGGATSQLSTE
jgi:NAD(P)-dependent dehydrogenase (short-subunit alcohol dehydrogenase family)